MYSLAYNACCGHFNGVQTWYLKVSTPASRTGHKLDDLGPAMNNPEGTAAGKAETDDLPRPAGDRLISIADIRLIFKLGRTAAYELTHRPEFPDRVEISPHCYRWWASEVDSFAGSLRRAHSQGSKRRRHEPRPPELDPPLRIIGTVRAVRGHTGRP
jgi:predicted DNA-binding transcriptional regulator AlpA